MNLPGITATDSMGYRIEALRVYLESQLSDIPFIAAYKHLVVSNTAQIAPRVISSLFLCRIYLARMMTKLTTNWRESLGRRK